MTPEHARRVMRGNKSKDTKPELRLRRALHARGLRYRTNHRIVVDGFACTPDVVFPKRRVAVFVDGCFWHACREHWRLPKSNVDFWQAKVDANLLRDERTNYALEEGGWAVIRVWEHDLTSDEAVGVAADRVERAVTWEPGGSPYVDEEGVTWDGVSVCCAHHPNSSEQTSLALDYYTQHVRPMFEELGDGGRGHLYWRGSVVCERCDVSWSGVMGRDCWTCGESVPQPKRRVPLTAEMFRLAADPDPRAAWRRSARLVPPSEP